MDPCTWGLWICGSGNEVFETRLAYSVVVIIQLYTAVKIFYILEYNKSLFKLKISTSMSYYVFLSDESLLM